MIMNKLSKADALTQLKQKATAKSKGSPLVLLFESSAAGDEANFVELLLTVQDRFGMNEFKKIPFEYLEKDNGNDAEFPEYLNFNKPLMHDDAPFKAKGWTRESHMVFKLLCSSRSKAKSKRGQLRGRSSERCQDLESLKRCSKTSQD